MSFWDGKRVVVTGGAGFLGSFVVESLRERGCRNVMVPRSRDYDLRDRDPIVRLYEETRPHIVNGTEPVNLGTGEEIPIRGKDDCCRSWF